MHDILQYVGIGGVVASIICLFVEITPIPFNPIGWLGSRLNSSIHKEVKKIEDKLDEHIVQSYRNTILTFQNELLNGKMHTQEEFNSVLIACDAYEAYITKNNISNGIITQATQYIRTVHMKCLSSRSFLNIPGGTN